MLNMRASVEKIVYIYPNRINIQFLKNTKPHSRSITCSGNVTILLYCTAEIKRFFAIKKANLIPAQKSRAGAVNAC